MKRSPLRRGSRLVRRNSLRRFSVKGRVRKGLRSLLRELVILRDGPVCRRCGTGKRPGRGGGLQAAHIMPVGQWPSMEFEPRNVIVLHAVPCHLEWWHKDVLAAGRWIREVLGDAEIDWLRATALMRKPKADPELTRLFLEAEIVRLGRRAAG